MSETQSENAMDEAGEQGVGRGDFLKWGSLALGGLYVGPKVTSFAVNKAMGQTGSPAPTPPAPTPPSPATLLPPTGGANGSPTGIPSQMPAWVPAAGAGAAAVGLYAAKQAKMRKLAREEAGAEDA